MIQHMMVEGREASVADFPGGLVKVIFKDGEVRFGVKPTAGFSEILKANPYHDARGRFATKDGANFVSIGGRFAKSNARDSATKFIQKDTFKEAAKVAKLAGKNVLRTDKTTLFKDIVAFKDKQWEIMTEEERDMISHRTERGIRPSKAQKSLAESRWQAKSYYKHEIKHEGKDPFAVTEHQKAQVQNAMNYNDSLPLYSHAERKFGRAPVYLMNFGKRTGLSLGASGQYDQGKVFMNADWLYTDKIDMGPSINAKGSVTREYTKSSSVSIDNGTSGILRHEYGHYIEGHRLSKEKRAEWDKIHNEVSGLPAERDRREMEDRYAKDTPLKAVSSYAQTNSMESFAEVFQLMTHPSFDRKKYHKNVQTLFDYMDREVFS